MAAHRSLLRAAAVLLGTAGCAGAGDMPLTLVPGTHCMDGTSAGYYYSAPSTPSSLWVFYLAGGGGCGDPVTCAGRVNGPLGSSSKWEKTHQGAGVYSGDPKRNPDFAGAHRVFVPYCSQDVHRGIGNSTTWGWYFQGHLNLEAIVDSLGPKGLSSATQVLLAGGSAGGVGAFHNVDWLAGRLGPKVTVKAAPDAGWFFPGALPADFPQNTRQPPPSYQCFMAGRPSSPACDAERDMNESYPVYHHPDCVAAQVPGGAWMCATLHVLYPFIKQPVYVTEAQYDINQLYVQKSCPKGDGAGPRAYIAMYGEAMRNSTQQVINNKAKRDGIFLPSCLAHGVGGIEIRGQSSLPVLGDWFFGHGKLSQYHQLVEDCEMTAGLPCNPSSKCQLSGSGPTPPTPPAPPPDAAACQKQMTVDGCLAAGSPSKCVQCAQSHKKDLFAAGCTNAVVKPLCNVTGPPSPPSPPSPSSPPAPPTPSGGGCAEHMAADGCLEPGHSEDACQQCAQAHLKELQAAGCSTGKINYACKNF